MGGNKLGFGEFIATVDAPCAPFVTELHEELTEAGCKMEVKEAKSGYVVSYLLNKKTVMNYVFRKKGLIVRIYANHISEYMDLLETIPAALVKNVEEAPVCKRLLDPCACNSKCAKGYDFLLNGKRYQKCRNSAFMFQVCGGNNAFIRAFLRREVAACACA